MALTECTTEIAGLCELESSCPMKNNQRVINEAVRGVLGMITLSDLMQPLQLAQRQGSGGQAGSDDSFHTGENAMNTSRDAIRELAQQEYKWGFVSRSR